MRARLSARVRARVAVAAFILLSLLAVLAPICKAQAQTQWIKGETRVATTNGYVRIVLNLAEEVESEVKVAGGIIIVSFKRPVQVPIERITGEAPDYISAARRDPDGMGLRIALARKVTVNSMAAGERLFIDLLPENWKGMAPGLPQEVIEDLARRAREAEKLLRQQRLQTLKKKPTSVRVRVANQPTFTRFVFELPEIVPVTSDRVKDNLTLNFAAPVVFDLTDAKLSLPSFVRSLDAENNADGVSVRFALDAKTNIRTFREDNNYVVDIVAAEGDAKAKDTAIDPASKIAELAKPKPAPAAKTTPLEGLEAPQTVPAKGAGKMQAAVPAPVEGDPSKTAPAPVVATPVATPAAKVAADTPPAAAPVLAAAPAKMPVSAENKGPVVPVPAVKASEATTAPAQPTALAGQDGIAAELGRQGDNLKLIFPFSVPTPAAIFRRADTLWMVFDSKTKIDLAALSHDTSHTIRSASLSPSRDGQVVRVTLERPRLISVSAEASNWTVIVGDAVNEASKPLAIARNLTGPSRASVTIPFEEPKNLHRITDPEIGDTILVVTALGPPRGFLRGQDFVEFRALASTHGVVVQPIADDVHAELSADKVIIGRPGGLTLSGIAQTAGKHSNFRPIVFDAQLWGFDRQSKFTERQYQLISAAADATEAKRTPPRLELARFYLAREMYAEAKGVLDVTLDEERPTAENPTGLVMRAVAEIMLNRPDEGLKDLGNPIIGNQHDAPLWRAFAYARQGKWAEARKGFKAVQTALSTLPIEMQRMALKEALRAAVEVKDFSGAANDLNEFETVGMTRQMEPAIRLLTGRVEQGLGRNEAALKNFRAAADSDDRPTAAEARLREILMRYGLGDLKRNDVISELETLTTLWRGDDTEIESLQLLARLYTEESRYRDAFYVMRTALTAHPNSEMTRRIHDEAAESFDSLFLAGKGDSLPAIEALSLFYDFRELTPVGRRGDEMIRRLADRLVSVDLLDQAAELLQHQVDHRLQGAARAQIATRLAVIYLMNRKPDRALATLKATRMGEFTTELRQLRLLLEARALSDMSRYDLALEVIANIDRREAIRLRSDILWAAKRYPESAEQIELLYGDRWREWAALNDIERADILRAAVGYGLGSDMIGLGRLREKYAGKMNEGPERRIFDIATAPLGESATEFRELAKSVAATNTLDNFLREMRMKFPEIGSVTANESAALNNSPAQPAAVTQ